MTLETPSVLRHLPQMGERHLEEDKIESLEGNLNN